MKIKTPSIVGVVMVTMFLMVFIALWQGLGMGAVLTEVADPGGLEDSTLEDYDAVESLVVSNDTVVVELAPDPRFSSAGDWGDAKITHLRLVSADGDISNRVEVPRGQQVFRFTPADGVNGNYTLSLIHHVPEDPGLSGHAAYDEEQVIEFRVVNGDLRVTSVPVVLGDQE